MGLRDVLFPWNNAEEDDEGRDPPTAEDEYFPGGPLPDYADYYECRRWFYLGANEVTDEYGKTNEGGKLRQAFEDLWAERRE